MGVQIEFVTIVFNLESIDQRYPGGRLALLREHQSLVGREVQADHFLMKKSSMGWDGISREISDLEGKGLRITTKDHLGRDVWDTDMCIVQSYIGLDIDCEWIEIVQRIPRASVKHIKDKTDLWVTPRNAEEVYKKELEMALVVGM